MTRYVLKRLLLLVPTLVIISMITFGLSTLTTGDPVERILGYSIDGEEDTRKEVEANFQHYKIIAQQYHYDLPSFYFSIAPSNYPDTLYRILPLSEKQYTIKLLKIYGDWSAIHNYQQAILKWRNDFIQREIKTKDYSSVIHLLNQLNQATLALEIESLIKRLSTFENDFFAAKATNISALFEKVKSSSRKNILLPKFTWYGFDNQYHHWFRGILKGDFGYSLLDKKPVIQKILATLPNTLWLNIMTLIIALMVGISFGVYMSTHPETWASKLLMTKLYAWLAIPSFWLASLLIVFLTTNDYGSWTNLFPSGGIGSFPVGASFFQKIFIRLSHLFLPVLSMALPTAAIIAIQIHRSLSTELQKTYIKTAILKGISHKSVIWKHGMTNAIFPLITLFGTILPGLIGGAIAIESIFNIPGMGQLLLTSIVGKDWPIVFGVLMITAVLTVMSLLIADLLYARLDPRIDLTGKQSIYD